MSTRKTNKSFAKRLKLTVSGKVLRRTPGQNHLLAKEKRRKQLAAKKWRKFRVSKKTLAHYLPYSLV